MKKMLGAINTIALLLTLISSCSATDLGSASTVHVETMVKINGAVVQKIVLETNTFGLTAETAESWFEPLKQEGWEITASSGSGVVKAAAQREFSQREFQSYIPSYQMVAANLHVKNYFVYKSYVLNTSLRALNVDEEGAVQDSLLQIIDLALVEQRLKMSWTVTMPGTLTEANTENIDGNSATWDINSGNIMQGVPVKISSRCLYWPGALGTAAGLLIAVSSALLVIKRRNKNPRGGANI
jgi:hypothetical protein